MNGLTDARIGEIKRNAMENLDGEDRAGVIELVDEVRQLRDLSSYLRSQWTAEMIRSMPNYIRYEKASALAEGRVACAVRLFEEANQ